MPKKYDTAIIGSGPAGYTAAIRLRELGKSVCVIDFDEKRLGGVCLNEGCIPVKSLIDSARLYAGIKKAEHCGLEASVKPPGMKAIVACSQNARIKLQNGLKGLFRKYSIELIEGRAKFVSRSKLSVRLKSGPDEDITADHIIIAAGSRPHVPAGVQVGADAIITSTEAIRIGKLPESILIIGAGAVGTEFSSLFASLGVKVTLAEMAPRILPFADEEVSAALSKIFKKDGIELLANTMLKSLKAKGGRSEAVLEKEGLEKNIETECALIAIGRRPNTEGMGIEEIGVNIKNGFIVADERMRTNIENIYAAGDVLNTPMYAHVAYVEGETAALGIAGLKAEPIDYESVPNVVFSEPQSAGVGLTEAEARKKGYDIIVAKQFFKANGMAVATRREEGFIKIIADKKTRLILGAHIIGSEATEIVHELVVAKKAKLKIDDISKAVHAHPTFSEVAADAAKTI